MKEWDLYEVILLVDCYNRIAEKGSESATSASLESYFDEEAEKLSKILREREREEKGTIDDRFRNVPGIKMKLHNIEFLATDGKSGLANFSAMDKKGYILYKTNPGQFYQLLSALKVDCRAEDVDPDSSCLYDLNFSCISHLLSTFLLFLHQGQISFRPLLRFICSGCADHHRIRH